MRFFITLLLFFSMGYLSAQDLTGIWRGSFFTSRIEAMMGSANKYEVQINNQTRGVKGVSYSYSKNNFYGKSTVVGMWSSKSYNLIFKEEKLLDFRNAKKEDVAMFTCYLEYRKDGDKEILEGTYESENYVTHEPSSGGKIYLERVTETDFVKEDFVIKKEEKEKAEALKKSKNQLKNTANKTNPTPPKNLANKPIVKKTNTTTNPEKNVAKQTPVVPKKILPKTNTPKPKNPANTIVKSNTKPPIKAIAKPTIVDTLRPKTLVSIEKPLQKTVVKTIETPTIFKDRKNELVKTIATPAKEITIELYDNGEIDGDTISVFLNGKPLALNRGLSTIPITLKITLDDDSPEQEITMFAENLGTIPPNTALMIVKAGANRYDLRLTSSEQKNAVVRFKYEKPK